MGLAGGSGEIHRIIAANLWTGEPHFVIHVDGSKKNVISNDSLAQKFKHKLQVFVVTADSPTTLRQVLNDIKKSRWWNHMAFYLILGWPSLESDCSNAQEILWAAWKMDILNAKFMCLDEMKKILIYTYNPYKSDAPNSWKLVKTYREKNNHPWTLFVRNHRVTSAEACRDLDFDKTSDVGGYKIRFLNRFFKDLFNIKINKKNGRYSFGGFQGVIFHYLLRYIKATPKMILLPGQHLDGTLITETTDENIHKYLTNKTADLEVNHCHLTIIGNASFVFPFVQSGLRIMTQFSGDKSQFSKIRSVFDYYSWLGFFLVSWTTAIFFKYCLGQSLMPSFLNYCRLICNAALPRLPKKVPCRIYLSGIFMFFLVYQGIFQGKLSSMLTKHIQRPNINTMSDLAHESHTICGHKDYHGYFPDQRFHKSFVEMEGYNCTKYVLNNSLAACIRDETPLIYEASRFHLHLSSDSIVELYSVYGIRDDWPLEQRINTFFKSMAQFGLIYHLQKKKNIKPLRALQIRKDMYENQTVKFITLQQLTFIFVMLGFGLGLATASFVVECNIHRIRRIIHRVKQ